MGATDIFTRLARAGIHIAPPPDGRIMTKPRVRLTDELRKLIRWHREQILSALADDTVLNDRFFFAMPGDPANDDEALRERAAIMPEANGWDDVTALRDAHW